jgi:hypothetical protein
MEQTLETPLKSLTSWSAEEINLSMKYALTAKKIAELREELREIEEQMLSLRPIEEWKVDGLDWKVRPTTVKTYSFEENDEPLRVLAESPYIPVSVKREVFELKPKGIKALKSLVGYGPEEEQLVKECLEVIGEKTRLTYTKKE